MEYDLNTTLIKPCLYSNDIIIASTKEQFEKKLKENKGKADRIAKLIFEKKELYFQSEEKAEWVVALNIANKKIAFLSKENAKKVTELILANKEIAHLKAKLIIADEVPADYLEQI